MINPMNDFLKTHNTSDFFRGFAEINRKCGNKDYADDLENAAAWAEAEEVLKVLKDK